MVREALQVTEVAIKLSALGIKNALALSLAYAKENPKVKGKTSLDRLLREGKELKIIALQSKDVGQFKELAKQYGVLFAVIKDKAQNEKVDVMFKAEDVAKLNRIYEQLGYAIPKVGYVFLTINEKTHQSESCEDLHTAPQLCRRLLDDMAITVMMQTKRNHNFTNMDKDEAVRVRAFWKPVIEKLPDYAYLCDEILREAQENEEENGIDLQ